MDHSAMDHSAMSMPRCSMNMLWNTQIENTCVVFRQWHITSMGTFVASFFAIVLLGLLFEYLRVIQVRMEKKVALGMRGKEAADGRTSPGEEALLIARSNIASVGRRTSRVPLPARLTRAALYGASTALSAFLMLVFMTYNAYLILAVVLGAAAGQFIFEADIDPDAVLFGVNAKGAVCH